MKNSVPFTELCLALPRGHYTFMRHCLHLPVYFGEHCIFTRSCLNLITCNKFYSFADFLMKCVLTKPKFLHFSQIYKMCKHKPRHVDIHSCFYTSCLYSVWLRFEGSDKQEFIHLLQEHFVLNSGSRKYNNIEKIILCCGDNFNMFITPAVKDNNVMTRGKGKGELNPIKAFIAPPPL